MIVRFQLNTEVVGVADMQEPAVLLPDRDAAVADGVTVQRDEEDRRVEAERKRSGGDSIPAFREL